MILALYPSLVFIWPYTTDNRKIEETGNVSGSEVCDFSSRAMVFLSVLEMENVMTTSRSPMATY